MTGRQAPRACRSCGSTELSSVVDLGDQPLANSYVERCRAADEEPRYPLQPWVCTSCWLMQLPELAAPEAIFTDYAYFSSYSESWLRHARDYAEMAIDRFSLASGRTVVEIASNDGYLLRNFTERGIRVLGIEPAKNVAEEAVSRGIPTRQAFFNAGLAGRLVEEGWAADLLVANNVLAHVPGLDDFVEGLAIMLAPGGTLTMEFPHLLQLIQHRQFDTIYHEHFSYFSMMSAAAACRRHGLIIYDVEELTTHGGSLRVYAGHRAAVPEVSAAVRALVQREHEAGLDRLETYQDFSRSAEEVKGGLLRFLSSARAEGRTVAAYGAPAKGNTLLNYCGVTTELIEYTVDISPHKQGHLLPGSRLPILPPSRIFETKPDYVLILPWNLEDEITQQMAGIRQWGGRFVIPIPEVAVLD